MFHIEGAQELGTIAAHVPYGIGQKYHTGKRIDTSDAEKKMNIFDDYQMQTSHLFRYLSVLYLIYTTAKI